MSVRTCENTLGTIWPDDLYFVVAATGGYINPGGQIFILPVIFGLNGGWKIRLFRNNTIVDYQQQIVGDPYFTYDPSTRAVTVTPDVALQEKFIVQAYKPVL